MADDFNRDPDTVGRCPPYPRQPFPASVFESRFLTSPHLTAFVLSHEHMIEALRGERIVYCNHPTTAFSISTMAVLW
jgi:hypothetical protein